MLSSFVYSALDHVGVPTLRRRRSRGAVVLCYHNVVDDPRPVGDPGLHLPAGEFVWQMAWLADTYTVVPLRELVERLLGGRAMRGLAAVTFDDAYQGSLVHAWPLLRGAAIPATLFVPSRLVDHGTAFWWDRALAAGTASHLRDLWIEDLQGDSTRILAGLPEGSGDALPLDYRPAEWSTIRQAARDGLDVALHTATHRNMCQLDDAQICREIEENRFAVREHCGVESSLLAYPYGLHDERVRGAVARAGVTGAATLDFGMNDPAGDPLALRRVNVPASISRAAFVSWATGLRMPHVA